MGESSSRGGFKVDKPWRLQGKIPDFHEGGRKLLAREHLSGEEEKRAQISLLLLAGSCLLPEPGKLHGSSVQERFPVAFLGTSP